MIKVHNVYAKLYPLVNSTGQNSLIITNDFRFSRLVLPSGVNIHYTNYINRDIIDSKNQEYNNCYMLYSKGGLSKEIKNYMNLELSLNKVNMCFEDEDFICMKQ